MVPSNSEANISIKKICFKSNTCRQSEVGQNTLGNDNQVTGFADQSDNIQQSTTPTTANQTTPTPTPTLTPTPTPTTASLTVIKIVVGNTNAIASDFAIHVSGINPTPANFNGSSPGNDVALSPGTFNVTETTSPNFITSFSSECSGNLTAGQHLTCTITNTPTCEECFTSLLNSTQISEVRRHLESFSLTEICNLLLPINTEQVIRRELIDVLPVTTVDEIIACLKAAGVVFAP